MNRPDAPSSPVAAWTANDLRGDLHAAPDKAARVQRMFAAIAKRYDLNNRLHSFGRDQAWRRKAVALCEVQPTDEVLDVACGTGDLTQAFARAGARSIVGLDFTPEMLELARAKAQAIGSLAAAITYRQGDAMDLPFANASFEIVSIAWGIRNVEDPLRALCEFRRVLRPGGRVCVLEFSEPANPVVRALNRVYTAKIMPVTASLIARDRSGAYRYLPRSVASFPGPAGFARLMQQAGFEPPIVRSLTFGVCSIFISAVPRSSARS